MEMKEIIENFDFRNVFTKTDKDPEEIDVITYTENINRELSNLKLEWDTKLITKIRTKLIELCKTVKRLTQREDDDNNTNEKTKPLVHAHQDKSLNKIILLLALQDYSVLKDFLKVVQCMLRGRI